MARLARYCGRGAPWAVWTVALAVLPALYWAGLVSIETVNMLGRYLCFAIVALGLDLIWGYTGILGLCQSLFFCLGAYAMGMHLALHGPLDGAGIPRCLYVVTSEVQGFQLPVFWKPFDSLPVAVLLGLLLPALSAGLIAFLAFRSRVKGVYFAILTQALTLAAYLVFCRNEMRLCGTNGLTNFVVLAGFPLNEPNTKLGLYLLSAAALLATYLGCRYLVRTRLGRILAAIRDNESRLRFSGYRPLYFKVFVFALSGLIAGLGGMLYAPQMGIITPTHMAVERSIIMVVWVAVGGRGTLCGAILGALAVNLAYNVFTSHWPAAWPFFLGALFIGVVLFFPDGLISLWRRWTARKTTTVIPVEGAVLAPAAKEGVLT